ncbi:cGMP dependent protein kinase, putative [Babesia bigemina]|uniref:cGMP-dependent protein kinase n=1 Tax=Babesia bigemina TaxID=5866 RepID=A0A061DD08_BABBI|nr:cGMP dependent protein kinase, putative [Babesia bigemina]CDR98117.1 cGMP dependent protein kinase, putative [Babesia bigemina]|eukprot:XP_012770303.1 cGMP dependent protein kinase, putative [Babesia bigemina]
MLHETEELSRDLKKLHLINSSPKNIKYVKYKHGKVARAQPLGVALGDDSAEVSKLAKYAKTREKTDVDIALIRAAIKNNLVCDALNEYEVDAFVGAMSSFELPQGATVVTQGANGAYFFIISHGEFDVYVDGELVNSMSRGTAFGEISLIHNTPRSATVKVRDCAGNVGKLWGVTRLVFRETLKRISLRNYAENREFLDCVTIFESLSDDKKNCITNALVESRFSPGECIVKQGDSGDDLYIIKQGNADVYVDGVRVRTISKGQYFGERAILYCETRSATIQAIDDTTCVSLSRDILLNVLGNLNHVLFRNIMMESLQHSDVFRQFTGEQLCELIESASIRSFRKNCTVLDRENGLKGIRYFIVLEGSVKVLYNNDEIGIMERGDGFGEEYITHPNVPFRHTVVALGGSNYVGCKLALLTKHAIQLVLGGENLGERLDYNNKMVAIRKVHIFTHLSDTQIDKLIKAIKTIRYKQNDTVFVEGEIGDTLYIIKSGEVAIIKDGIKIRTLGKHDYFGERSLLYDEQRSASVIGNASQIDLWVVEKPIFMEIMEPTMLQHLEKRIKMQDTRVQFQELKVVKTIGHGTFGTVKLVTHETTGVRFALKCVSRKCIRALKQEKHIKLEREIMAQNDHPFIIQLVKTFKDAENVYFLTELVTGGELYDAIRKIGLLSRSQAQFYIASIVLAFEYLHERQIAYRDLKPENILLDEQGYIKLIDFGCAKKIKGRAYTLIGTPHYMAPEVILGKGYGCLADVWSFGICLYEFICGPLPFGNDAQDQIDIFRDILKGNLSFPEYIKDQDAINIINRLLCRVPESKYSAFLTDNIQDFDWDKLSGRAMQPPYVPNGETYNEDEVQEQVQAFQEMDDIKTDDDWELDF